MSDTISGLFWILASLAALGGWLQHLFTCFTHELWGFLVAGALFIPVGVFHGWGIWLGVW